MPQSFTRLLCHLVFSTKDRRPWMTKNVRDRLYQYVGGILRTRNGVVDLLRNVKAGSSKWVHDTFPELRDFAWQGGYGAFTVSASQIHRVKTYIETQEDHHRKEDFKTEFVRLLKAHDI